MAYPCPGYGNKLNSRFLQKNKKFSIILRPSQLWDYWRHVQNFVIPKDFKTILKFRIKILRCSKISHFYNSYERVVDALPGQALDLLSNTRIYIHSEYLYKNEQESRGAVVRVFIWFLFLFLDFFWSFF